jgi:hypothetical protein
MFSRVSWRHIDISGYLQHPSDNGLLDGLISRCIEFDAGYKLNYLLQKFKIPLNLYTIPSILGNAAHFYCDNVEPPRVTLRPYSGHAASFLRFLDHTQRHTRVGRAPLEV